MTSMLGYMLVCSFTPGPGNILALNTTSKYGLKKGKNVIIGICLGYGIVQTICTIILYQLKKLSTTAITILQIVGAVYMVYLAIHIIISKKEEITTKQKPLFIEGLLLQLINVKIYFYISTLLTAYFIPQNYNLFYAGVFAVSIGSIACLTWALLGAKLQNFYMKYFKQVNLILGLFLFYCAINIIKI